MKVQVPRLIDDEWWMNGYRKKERKKHTQIDNDNLKIHSIKSKSSFPRKLSKTQRVESFHLTASFLTRRDNMTRCDPFQKACTKYKNKISVDEDKNHLQNLFFKQNRHW